MKLSAIARVIDELAPLDAAESWDNVGLLVGDPASDVTNVLLAIDCTLQVVSEAERLSAELVIAYHPPIFQGLKRIPSGSVVDRAIRSHVALYSPHTALDVADGGTNDFLAEAIGLRDSKPLRPIVESDRAFKLVFFVPDDAADRVCDAVFRVGAGVIGRYSSCSFRHSGIGSFYGESGSTPVVGSAGHLERVSESRVETLTPISKVGDVIDALRKSHPYEEPAFDLVRIAGAPGRRGMGRIGGVAETRDQIIARVKERLGVAHLLVAGPTSGPASRAAVAAGSAGSLLDDVIAQGADVYVTGELRHHDALRAAERGVTVVATLHSVSERAALSPFAARLRERCGGVAFHLSASDRDPFAIV